MKSSKTVWVDFVNFLKKTNFSQIDKYAQLHILTHEGLGTFKLRVMFVPTMLIQ